LSLPSEPRRRLISDQIAAWRIPAFVDDLHFERLPDDLAHAFGRQSLLARDLVIGSALAQPRENAPAPQDPRVRCEPARERRRPFVHHPCLAQLLAWRHILTKRRIIALILII
jgi:hypothetical protein